MSVNAMAGIMRGIKTSQDRYTKIQAARDQKRQKDEMFELEKKKINLQIEAEKKKGEPDPFLDIIESQINDQFKAQEAQSKVEDNQINTALNTESKKLETLKRTGSKVAGALMKQQQSPFDWSYNTGSRSLTIKPRKRVTQEQKVSSVDKVLGSINMGGVYDQASGQVTEFTNREEALNYAETNLGFGWQEKFPEAVNIIERDFGFDLPSNLVSTSEAVNYLTQEKGMSEEQAVKWLQDEFRRNDEGT